MIKRKIETILFVIGEAIKIEKIAEILDVSKEEIISQIDILNEEYKNEEKGYEILIFDSKIELATNDRYLDLIDEVINISSRKGLSASMLEVLSIVAYNGPITRAKINHMRGVNSDFIVKKLLDRDLIKTSGRLDVHGKPHLYVTTDRFLKNFSLDSLKDLPKVD